MRSPLKKPISISQLFSLEIVLQIIPRVCIFLGNTLHMGYDLKYFRGIIFAATVIIGTGVATYIRVLHKTKQILKL